MFVHKNVMTFLRYTGIYRTFCVYKKINIEKKKRKKKGMKERARTFVQVQKLIKRQRVDGKNEIYC